MSVRTLSAVWEHSRHGGTELLMLLAIADFSDDDGFAYPSVRTLARKCRMKQRNAQHILACLRASGELQVRLNEGPRGTNRYRVMLVNSKWRNSALPTQEAAPTQKAAPTQEAAPTREAAPAQISPPVQTDARRDAAACASPMHIAAPEPSLNLQEPPAKTPSRLPPCPHRKLLTMFAERVPQLPRPRAELWEKSVAARDMAERWKWVLSAHRETGERYAANADEALAWFDRFFVTVAQSDFLCGRSGNWQNCNLQWLMKAANFAKVVEGNYSQEVRAA